MKQVAVYVLVAAALIAGCKKAEQKQDTSSQTAGSGTVAAKDPWADKAPAKLGTNPLPHPLFWKIEKDGKTTYALGTIHRGIDAETRLPQVVWDKLDAASAFAMETDLADPTLAKMLECSNCSLKRDLGPDYYAKLEKALTPRIAAAIEKQKIATAATLLETQFLPDTSPMDLVLFNHAKAKSKPVVYLESASKDMELLDKWMNAKAVKSILDEDDFGEKSIKDLLASYIAGDIDKMHAEYDEEKADALKHGYTEAEYEEQMNDMLVSRNASWIEPIEKMHQTGNGFIAVGALHLVGPKNVLELLAAKGYTITRIEK
ncbi:MAG TPA: TraB/GumN family protein [Kofleriaceae bacterium]|jgi:hypothetical protein